MGEKALVVFQDRKIRRMWYDNEWYYSVVDIVEVLTESPTPRQYWGKIKDREFIGIQLSPIWVRLKLIAEDGKLRETDCANAKSIFRIIQSIPSPKAEPFKLWLAQLGQERIEEIQHPELAIERARRYYESKGYPPKWIAERIPSILIRQELTQEWKERGISEKQEFAILTDEIAKAAFGKSVNEYKEFKRLRKQNLRDNMGDLELIFTILSEKAAVEITKAKDNHGFDECKSSAKRGGEIAKNARKELERETGRAISERNMITGKKKFR
ncbi:MAG: Bro-N domain-containing protein [Candidatus Woesearchaeota archaeon]